MFPNSGGRTKSSVSSKSKINTPKNGATAAYGETSGVYPKKIDSAGSTYDPNNWDLDSAADLQEARKWIADLQRRNPAMKYWQPHGDNPIEKRQWDLSNEANRNSLNASDREVGKLLMIQEGVEPQGPPDSWIRDGWVLHKSFGPFVSVGGGPVQAGDRTYIQFYKQLPLNMRPRK
jgi:hypothetical protein